MEGHRLLIGPQQGQLPDAHVRIGRTAHIGHREETAIAQHAQSRIVETFREVELPADA